MKLDPNQKLKILIINYEHPPVGGGGGQSTKQLARAFAEKGHMVHILTTGYKGLPKVQDENGYKLFRVPVIGRSEIKTASDSSMLTFPITSIPKALMLCLKYKYDVINTHFYAPSGPTGMVASFLSRIPNVLYVHGADIYDPSRLEKTPAGKGILSKLLLLNTKLENSLARRIACQSNNTKENILSVTGTKRDIRVIPLPFEKPKHPKISRKALSMKPNGYYLLAVGRAVERKGYEYLIEAMTKLDKNIYLNIIGGGPVLPKLKKLVTRLKLKDRVKLLDYVVSDEVKFQYYSQSDMFVLSSLHEGMGIVVQEGMEFGLPIVSTNYGGQTDLLKEGRNAIMVDPKDPEQLAKAITKVFLSKFLQEKLGKNNAEDIKQYYSDKIADRFLDLYREAIEE